MPGPALLLIPTPIEAKLMFPKPPPAGIRAELCGFSLAIAGTRTLELLHEIKPRRVLLVGIAGSWNPDLAPLESVHTFARVRLDGIGAGEVARFEGPAAMGLALFAGASGAGSELLHDELPLAGPGDGTLVSVASAAGSPEEVFPRRRRHAGALEEDMEAFAVAFACQRAGLPLTVVRGISNIAGERDKSEWRVKPALDAARSVALELATA